MADVLDLMRKGAKQSTNLHYDFNNDGRYTVMDALSLLLFVLHG